MASNSPSPKARVWGLHAQFFYSPSLAPRAFHFANPCQNLCKNHAFTLSNPNAKLLFGVRRSRVSVLNPPHPCGVLDALQNQACKKSCKLLQALKRSFTGLPAECRTDASRAHPKLKECYNGMRWLQNFSNTLFLAPQRKKHLFSLCSERKNCKFPIFSDFFAKFLNFSLVCYG